MQLKMGYSDNNITRNSTANLNEGSTIFTTKMKLLLCMCYIIVLILGFTGNIIVIYMIGIKHGISRSFDVYILSLAVSDFLGAIFTSVVGIHDAILEYRDWRIFGVLGCKLFVPMNHMTLVVSCCLLVTISIIRLD